MSTKEFEVGQIVRFDGYKEESSEVVGPLVKGELVELTGQVINSQGLTQYNAKSVLHKGVMDSVLPSELSSVRENEFKDCHGKSGILFEIKNLIGTLDEYRYSLGGLLSYIKEYMLHHELGYTGQKGFSAYVEQELGLNPGNVRYYLDVYKALSALGLTEKDLRGIKWSSLIYISTIANLDNIEELLEFAKRNAVNDVKAYVNSYKARTGHTTEMVDITQAEQARLHHLKISMFEDQMESIFKPAVEQARLSIANSNAETGECVLHILQEWLMFTSHSANLQNVISFIENKYNVNIEVKDKKNKISLVNTQDEEEDTNNEDIHVDI